MRSQSDGHVEEDTVTEADRRSAAHDKRRGTDTGRALMSYDLAIWKRSATTKTAMLAEAYKCICDGGSPSAMAPFDLAALESALKHEFGDYSTATEGEILCESGTAQGVGWLVVHCAHSAAASISQRVASIALSQGLLVYAGPWPEARAYSSAA